VNVALSNGRKNETGVYPTVFSSKLENTNLQPIF